MVKFPCIWWDNTHMPSWRQYNPLLMTAGQETLGGVLKNSLLLIWKLWSRCVILPNFQLQLNRQSWIVSPKLYQEIISTTELDGRSLEKSPEHARGCNLEQTGECYHHLLCLSVLLKSWREWSVTIKERNKMLRYTIKWLENIKAFILYEFKSHKQRYPPINGELDG